MTIRILQYSNTEGTSRGIVREDSSQNGSRQILARKREFTHAESWMNLREP